MTVTLTGIFEKQALSKGSKSEHTAIVLKTDSDTFRLRLVGDNPFSTTSFDQFEGQKAEVTGTLLNKSILIVQSLGDIVPKP